jgi:hypothetical protein
MGDKYMIYSLEQGRKVGYKWPFLILHDSQSEDE